MVIFQQRLEGDKRLSQMEAEGRHSRNKIPKERGCVKVLENNKEAVGL